MTDRIPSARTSIDPETMKDWARLLGDPNPIHLDAELAASLGYPGVIVQGPANLAFIINALAAAFPDARIAGLSVRFLDNAFGGETVEAGGTVVARETIADGERLTCEVKLAAGDRPVISGTATLIAPNPSH